MTKHAVNMDHFYDAADLVRCTSCQRDLDHVIDSGHAQGCEFDDEGEMPRIYLASSWRNPYQPPAVERLRAAGFEVYDFRNPPNRSGFSWSEIDPGWRDWSVGDYRAALAHPDAEAGFRADLAGMRWANAFVLLLPCGRSAHLEAGWAIGRSVPTWFVSPEPFEPELMVKLAGHPDEVLCDSIDELIGKVRARFAGCAHG